METLLIDPWRNYATYLVCFKASRHSSVVGVLGSHQGDLGSIPDWKDQAGIELQDY